MMRRVWPVVVAGSVLLLYLLRLDTAAGLYVDDAWYIVLAQALAQGDGFTLISSAAQPILPAFPPAFPLLLAPVFAVHPDFPGNVLWLKAVSIVAMFGVGIATYFYLTRVHAAPRLMAGSVALIIVVTPAFVFLATSTVMAECAFTLGQLAMALMVERAAAPSPRSRLNIALAAALGVATLLIRSAGIASLVAGALYLAKKRGWRASAGFVAVAALCYLPWALYAQSHRPTAEARLAHGGAVAYAYGDLLAMRQGGIAGSGRIGVSDLSARVGANLINVFGRDLGALIVPGAYRGPAESGQEAFALGGETGLRAGSMGGGSAILVTSSLLSAIALIGFFTIVRTGVTVAELIVPITIAMVVLVPARTFRYVLPLAPFVVFYFFRGIEAVGAWIARDGRARAGAAVRISVLCVLGLVGMEHTQYVWQAQRGPLLPWFRDFQEVQAVGDWMNSHLTEPSAVVATNPGLVYLLTGRKTVALVDTVANWERWRAMGVRHAVAFHVTEQPPARLGYRVIYTSPRLGLWVLELRAATSGLTESASRP